jgi:hypothetical protein
VDTARLRLLERRAYVVVVHDSIPLKHADGPVPGDHHRHALIDAGIHEVPDRAAPQIVE